MNGCHFLAYGIYMDPKIFKKALKEPTDLEYELVMVSGKRFLGAVDISKGINSVFHPNGELKSKDVAVLTIAHGVTKDYNAVLYRNLPYKTLEERILEAQSKRGFAHTSLAVNKSWRSSVEICRFEDENVLIGGGFWDRVYTIYAKRWLEIQESKLKKKSYMFVRKDISPNPSYLERVKNAARVHGADFEDAFLRTTFLADSKTRLTDRLGKL
jgi:hypothetical protein